MARLSHNGKSYGHTCKQIGVDSYEISWCYDTMPNGGRIRNIAGNSMTTDEAGARRFCKKWGLDMPAIAAKEKVVAVAESASKITRKIAKTGQSVTIEADAKNPGRYVMIADGARIENINLQRLEEIGYFAN